MKPLRVAAGAVAAAAFAAPAGAFPEGSPWGHSGRNDESCAACHFTDAALNQSDSLSLSGLPERYEPGVDYELTLRLDAAAINGFQIEARTSGAPGGVFTSSDRAVETDGARARSIASRPAWTLTWTAPERAMGEVTIFVAMVAGNDDLSPFEDVVHLRRYVVAP